MLVWEGLDWPGASYVDQATPELTALPVIALGPRFTGMHHHDWLKKLFKYYCQIILFMFLLCVSVQHVCFGIVCCVWCVFIQVSFE